MRGSSRGCAAPSVAWSEGPPSPHPPRSGARPRRTVATSPRGGAAPRGLGQPRGWGSGAGFRGGRRGARWSPIASRCASLLANARRWGAGVGSARARGRGPSAWSARPGGGRVARGQGFGGRVTLPAAWMNIFPGRSARQPPAPTRPPKHPHDHRRLRLPPPQSRFLHALSVCLVPVCLSVPLSLSLSLSLSSWSRGHSRGSSPVDGHVLARDTQGDPRLLGDGPLDGPLVLVA